MNPFSYLLLFMVFSSVVFLPHAEAKGIEDNVFRNPAGVGELVVNITQYGTVESDGTPTKITINFSIPQDDGRQDVSLDVKKAMDNLGTSIGVIESSSPGNTFSYSLSGVVKSRANHLTSLPSSYTIPDDVEAYLKPTKNIQSDDASVRQLALGIIRDSRDDFERIAKLAIWVHDNLDYDLSYTGKNLDALSVLSGRRGVCAEYTTLFIALARSIGIPAKFVSGYSYGDMGWERHAYAEVYLGKWIPVDPLWLEIGYLDATHLKFGNHLDSLVKNNVEVSGYNVRSINWLQDDVNFSTVSFSPIEKVDYNLSISGDELRKGDDGVVTLSIVPREFIVGKLVLEPCSGDYGIVDVAEKEKKVMLRPGERELVYWKIKISPDLPKNNIFTCPLTLNSRSLALKTVDAVVNTQYQARSLHHLSANLGSSVVELGDEQKVYITLSGLSEPVKAGIIAGDEKEEWDIGGSDFQTVFSFKPKDLGENEVMIYTSEGEVAVLKYSVMSHLNVQIENIAVPSYMKTGETANVTADIVNKGAVQQNVRLNVNVDGKDNLANFILKDRYHVSLPVSFTSPGLKKITFGASGEGLNLSETGIIEVYEEPVVSYETEYNEGKAILKLEVTKSRIKNVTIKIGSEERTIGEVFGKTNVDFSLVPGQYQMEIACQDIAGKPYNITEPIEFREKNIFEKIIEAINSFFSQLMKMFGQ